VRADGACLRRHSGTARAVVHRYGRAALHGLEQAAHIARRRRGSSACRARRRNGRGGHGSTSRRAQRRCRHGGLDAAGTAHRHDAVAARATVAQQLHRGRRRRRGARSRCRTVCRRLRRRRSNGRRSSRRRSNGGRSSNRVRRGRSRQGPTRDHARRRQRRLIRETPRCTARQDHDGSQGDSGKHPHHHPPPTQLQHRKPPGGATLSGRLPGEFPALPMVRLAL